MVKEDFIQIKKKIISGVLALTTRTFILQIIAFLATFILTILLSPSAFGVFYVVSAIISFLSYFSDIGLAAALIQKKTDPSREELVTAFTIQQLLVGTLVISAIIISPTFVRFYQIENEGLFLLKALLISFLLSSLKTIPSVILERKLDFNLLIIPQIIETFTFYLVAIVLAFLGKGIISFAWAALARGVVGLFTIYLICPWRIGVGISKIAVRRLLSFGIPFQANSILALIKDDLMTIFLGKILSFTQLGYVGWAKKWAETPLRLVMDNIIKVTFPAYARLQDNKKILSRAISKSLFFLSLFIFPAILLLTMYIKPMVYLIPRYIKWEPAIISFYLFAFSSVLAAFSSPLINMLNALGKINTTLKIMIFWTILTWFLVPISVTVLGYNGVAFASLLISFTAFIPIFVAKKNLDFSIINPISKPLISTLLVGVIVLFIQKINLNFFLIIVSFFLAVFLYLFLIFAWMRKEIWPYLPKFITKKWPG